MRLSQSLGMMTTAVSVTLEQLPSIIAVFHFQGSKNENQVTEAYPINSTEINGVLCNW